VWIFVILIYVFVCSGIINEQDIVHFSCCICKVFCYFYVMFRIVVNEFMLVVHQDEIG
jgi:hypothetical protein